MGIVIISAGSFKISSEQDLFLNYIKRIKTPLRLIEISEKKKLKEIN